MVKSLIKAKEVYYEKNKFYFQKNSLNNQNFIKFVLEQY